MLLTMLTFFSVFYEMPRSVHVHKSMLLRGVNFLPPVLDKSDIENTKNQASRSGRSFGGAPFRGGGRGNGRGGRGGGQINYANDRNERPNPFAAHLNPNFAPPPISFGRGAPPASGSYGAPPPRQTGYQNAVPPPSRGGYQGGPPSLPAYRGGPPPPPQGGYYGGASQNGYRDNYGNGQSGQYGGRNYGPR